MTEKVPVTVATGDGIGPEIMDATLNILDAAGANLDYEFIDIGESVYKQGYTSGIKPEAWESLRRTGVFLKAPITTPQGGGLKPERYDSENAGAICQHPAVPIVRSVCCDQASPYRCGYYP